MLNLLSASLLVSLCLSGAVFWAAPQDRWRPLAWRLLDALTLGSVAVGLAQWSGSGDPLAGVMLVLVGFLGWVIGRFSRNYLAGDPAQGRYLRWLGAVLACVAWLVSSQNLLAICLAWTGTSLCLHQLLTLYPERKGAMEAAHKKFLLARLADLAMLSSVFLLYRELGTLEILPMADALAHSGTDSPSLQLAACLLAAAAILKCGQLPFHGWLISVMEAPTPVSALLHAGVVNIGGFLMIRMAFLLSASEPAQLLLVGWGGATAVLAALVMSTRSHIKGSLAWSTCAQMGFMLVECGLGAYSLALLHLVAHSLYKAYRFLSAGDTVVEFRRRQLAAELQGPSSSRWLVALSLSLVVAVAAPIWGAYALCMTPLWARALGRLRLAAASVLVASFYVVQHQLVSQWLPSQPPSSVALVLAGVHLLALLVACSSLWLAPSGRLAGWIYARAVHGFWLDEKLFAWTQRLWPAPSPSPSVLSWPSLRAVEAL